VERGALGLGRQVARLGEELLLAEQRRVDGVPLLEADVVEVEVEVRDVVDARRLVPARVPVELDELVPGRVLRRQLEQVLVEVGVLVRVVAAAAVVGGPGRLSIAPSSKATPSSRGARVSWSSVM
jgi:hypothetical protein